MKNENQFLFQNGMSWIISALLMKTSKILNTMCTVINHAGIFQVPTEIFRHTTYSAHSAGYYSEEMQAYILDAYNENGNINMSSAICTELINMDNYKRIEIDCQYLSEYTLTPTGPATYSIFWLTKYPDIHDNDTRPILQLNGISAEDARNKVRKTAVTDISNITGEWRIVTFASALHIPCESKIAIYGINLYEN